MSATRRQFIATSAATAAAAFAYAQGNLSASQHPASAPSRKPNIVLLFADDLGYGDLGSYGNPVIQTPVLDNLAAGGARFTSFYAQPACTASRAALLTGRYPVRPGGVEAVIGPDSEQGLPPGEITIAKALKGQGYRTKAIGKWHLGHAKEEYLPNSHGFDEYFGLLYSNDMIKPWVQTDRPLRLYRDNEPIEGHVDQRTLTARYTEEAVRFIKESADAPFFLYLPYAMTHLPLAVSDRFRGKSRGGLYGDAVEELDWSAGEILYALHDAGVADNTLIIWTSDNGPWQDLPSRMLQAGPDDLDNKPWHVGTPGPFRESKGSTYEGGVRVPAIFYWPGQIPAGQVVRALGSTLDVLPTVLTAAGAKIPDDRPIDGNDLLPFLRGETMETPAELHYYFRGSALCAVRKGAWKLQLLNGRDELYQIEQDFGERTNLAAEYPAKVTELRALMDSMARETSTTIPELVAPAQPEKGRAGT